jgi:hypothetical protein
MATFTMELRDVLWAAYGEQEYAEFKFNESTYGKLPVLPDPAFIGLGSYPIFDEEYRAILNGKIVDEYFTREIGTETIDNFALMMRRKMDQIMPYYNKLYLSEQIPYTALDTMRIHTVGKLTGIEEVKASATADSLTGTDANSRAVSSQTPQTMLAGNEDYATAATDSVSKSDVVGKSTQDTESDSTNNTESDNLVTGYQAVASDLIQKYRSTLLNIDTSILLEVQDCFMLLLNNNDAYTPIPYYASNWNY